MYQEQGHRWLWKSFIALCLSFLSYKTRMWRGLNKPIRVMHLDQGPTHSKCSTNVRCNYHLNTSPRLADSLVLPRRKPRPGEGKDLAEVTQVSSKRTVIGRVTKPDPHQFLLTREPKSFGDLCIYIYSLPASKMGFRWLNSSYLSVPDRRGLASFSRKDEECL